MSNKKFLWIGLAVLTAIAIVGLSSLFARGDGQIAAGAEGRVDREEVAPGYDLYNYVRPALEGNPMPRRLPSFVPQVVDHNFVATQVAGTEPEADHYETEFDFSPNALARVRAPGGRFRGTSAIAPVISCPTQKDKPFTLTKVRVPRVRVIHQEMLSCHMASPAFSSRRCWLHTRRTRR
ncbi:hypothetical protein KR51_00021600 [Rubidibacter lacunae KORDI 51-2]|uniref:Uncharacterized protein n=1 Tax=Rubidibacter lacunae KORDI 51-2 TaxID=582515 RepID=U5DNI6_9CHRO|nr:hypothetical protein [Rubidibacter lacunae]ERN41270.1 hypothetical protein KR51_00021600 [Rubidibacter lacunae KORDI 51-2]